MVFCWAATLLVAYSATAQTADPAARIEELLDRADASTAKGDYPDVVAASAEALQLSEAAHNQHFIARSLLASGSGAYYQGRFLDALDQLQRGDLLAERLDDVPLQKQAKRMLGNSYRQLGRFDDAERAFEAWVRLNRRLPVPENEGSINRTLSILYREMGEADKAAAAAHTAFTQALAAGDKRLQASILLTLGALEKDRNRYREAIPLHQQALALAEAIQAKDLQSEILNSMGDAYTNLGEPDRAVECLRSASALAHAIGYRGVEIQTTVRLGELARVAGRYSDAVRFYEDADALYRENGGMTEKRFQVQARWGDAERAMGRKEEALAHYREAVALAEQLQRFTVPTEIARALPVGWAREVAEPAADLLVEMHRPAEALEMAERCRARAFLDLLNESQVDIRSTLTADQRSHEEELMRQVAQNRDHPQALAAALSAEEAFYVDLRRSNPAYAHLARPELATASRIRTELTDGATAFVEYLLGDQRSMAWVVTPDAVEVAILPPRTEIESQVKEFRRILGEASTPLTSGVHNSALENSGRKLFTILFAPVLPKLGTAHRLRIVADGVLGYLPFEALRSPRGYLLEQYTISYSASASATLALRSEARGAQRTKALLAFGDADYAGGPWTQIPQTREEVLGICREFPPHSCVAHLGADAAEAVLKREDLERYRYLHFAVHAFVDEANPGRSGLVLSRAVNSTEDGVLRMEEIARLRISADLVTLSACETGVGRLLRGEGLMALSRAFFYAGARNVAGALWNVNDRSTAELMRNLYAGIERGQAPEEALRAAKLKLLRGSETLWRDPHYWAAFILMQ